MTKFVLIFAFSITAAAQSPVFSNFVRSNGDEISCKEPPRRGEIQVLYAKYGKVEGCGYWKASNALVARLILRDFDNYESHAPEVIYKSYGTFPIYTQKVVIGGCPPDGKHLNCAD